MTFGWPIRRRLRRRRAPGSVVLVILLIAAFAMWRREGSEPPGAGVAAPEIGASERGRAFRVARVVDGDTIHVEVEGGLTPIEKIRLLRIDTPERGQPGHERATAALKALVEDREVELVFETPGAGERDDYGRLLAYVLAGDANVNVELVRGGWTPFFTRYGEGRFAAQFRAAEAEARAANAGLWSESGWNVSERIRGEPNGR